MRSSTRNCGKRSATPPSHRIGAAKRLERSNRAAARQLASRLPGWRLPQEIATPRERIENSLRDVLLGMAKLPPEPTLRMRMASSTTAPQVLCLVRQPFAALVPVHISIICQLLCLPQAPIVPGKCTRAYASINTCRYSSSCTGGDSFPHNLATWTGKPSSTAVRQR